MKVFQFVTKYFLLLCLLIPSIALAMGRDKVKVCHDGRVINISENALPAHEGHGDFLIEEDDDECFEDDDDDQDEDDDDDQDEDEDEDDDQGDSDDERDDPPLDVSDLDSAVYTGGFLFIPEVEIEIFGQVQIYAVVLEYNPFIFGFELVSIEALDSDNEAIENAVFANNIIDLILFFEPADQDMRAELELISASPVVLTVTDFEFIDSDSEEGSGGV